MKTETKKLIQVIATALAIGGIGFFGLAFVLQPFFSGQVTLPQNISIGRIGLQFYGVIIGLSALAGYWLVLRRRKLYKIEADDADTIFFVVIVSGFIGARIYHVISEIGIYLSHPNQIFAVWNGGLSIFGAALGGLVGVLLYRRYVKKYSFWQLLDWLIPGLVLGQIIGRFGNFVNYELYGNPTNLPWKMSVPVPFRLPPFETFQYFHPLFLYELAGSIVILVLLLGLKLRNGSLFLLWLLLYNVMRFFLEFMRVGSVTYSGIRVNAVVSLLLAGLAVYIWYHIKYRFDYAIPDSSNN